MYVVGLCGGIASGKSSVANRLREKHEMQTVDCDLLGHQAYLPNTEGHAKVVAAFGKDVLAKVCKKKFLFFCFQKKSSNKDGSVDRRVLGSKVFGDAAKLRLLSDIVWREIGVLLSQKLSDLRNAHISKHKSDLERKSSDSDSIQSIVVVEAAVLIEAGWQNLCDEVWSVSTSEQVAIARLAQRNGLDADSARKRIQSQMANEQRNKHANVVIENNGSVQELNDKVDKEVALLKQRVANKAKLKKSKL